MLAHWIQPLSKAEAENFQKFGPDTLGSQCIFDHEALPETNIVAILGWEKSAADKVRDALYRFADLQTSIKCVDLGNFKKSTPDFAIPALHELIESGIPWVLIGGSDPLLDLHMTLYETREKSFSAVTLHENPVFPKVVSQRRNLNLKDFHILGAQAHLNSAAIRRLPFNDRIHWHRLGSLKNGTGECEPVMRNADLVNVHLSVLRYADSPAQFGLSASGLFSEDVCQIMRYAGFGNKMRTVSITGWDVESPFSGPSANVVAQMIWYYLEAREKSNNLELKAEDKMTQYLVHLDISDTDLVFFKDEQFGTWWVKPQYANGNGELLPCSYEDYLAACNNTLSDRIFRLVQQFQ